MLNTYRTSDTSGLGAIVNGVCAQARCDVVGFRLLFSVDIHLLRSGFDFWIKYQRCLVLNSN